MTTDARTMLTQKGATVDRCHQIVLPLMVADKDD